MIQLLFIDEKDEDVRENLLRLIKPWTPFKMNVQGLINKNQSGWKKKEKKIQHEMNMQQTGVATEKVIVLAGCKKPYLVLHEEWSQNLF